MAVEGSLFILHLVHESKVIKGDSKIIDYLKNKFVAPKNYTKLRKRLKAASMLLDVDEQIYENHHVQLNSLAIYLIRSFIYSKMVDDGKIIFSMKEIIETLNYHDLEKFLLLKTENYSNYKLFCECKKIIEFYFRTSIKNPYISIEALLIRSYEKEHSSLMIAMGIRVLNTKNKFINYDNLANQLP